MKENNEHNLEFVQEMLEMLLTKFTNYAITYQLSFLLQMEAIFIVLHEILSD